MSQKETIKELLIFTKTERKGVIILLTVIILLIVVNFSIKFLIPQEKSDFKKFDTEIAGFTNSLVPQKEDAYLNRLDKYIVERYDSLQLFKFNPNTTTATEWKNLGLTDKQIKTVLNYTSKGGKFVDKQDFKKIYGIRHKQYEILKPYIQLPEKVNYSKSYSSNYYKKNYYKENYNQETEFSPDSLFEFDPNKITASEWDKLGFSKKQIGVIQNYLNKGGKFYKKEDFKKIYCIKPEQYNQVENYIKIPKSNNGKTYEDSQTKRQVVDINSLSVEEFKKLGKFWKFNAKQIVDYRNKLGGFVSKKQLLEVWSVKKKYYDKLEDEVYIDKSKIRKIRLNFAEDSTLANHPYLNWTNAKDIVKHIDEKGRLKKIEDLRKYFLVSRTTFKKIKPYLSVK